MLQKTVLKVDISDERWKKKILKAVSGIPGVDIVEADVAKGTLTVTGGADPYEIIVRTKKTGKCVQVVSIGPPPAPQKPADQKKPQPEKKPPDDKKSDQQAQTQPQPRLQLQPYIPHPYMAQNYTPSYMGETCQRVAVVYVSRQDQPNPACVVM